MKQKINIAFAVNDPYVEHVNVTIYSILKNNPGRAFTFFVLCESLTNKSKEMIGIVQTLYKNADIRIIELKDMGYGFNKLVIPKNVSFITKEMYFRYALPEILYDLDKVLYLDADLIALGDISGLYSDNIDEYYIAGAIDAGIAPRFPGHLASLGMSDDDMYVNSGVLLMNLAKMRENNILEKLLENTKKYKKQLLFPDQDVLNLTLKGFIKPIKYIYNFTDQNMLESKVDISDVKIVHFTGGIKPWHSVRQAHTQKYTEKYNQYKNEYYSLVATELNLLISIIIPVYNISEEHLRECFESIKEQTYKNVEVIIIDDGSKRSTANFIDAYVKNLDSWQVIHQKNTGVNIARKVGFEKSSGEFVTFVDSDDMVAHEFCERLYKTAIKIDADTTIAERYDFDDNEADHPVVENKQPDDVLRDRYSIIKAHRVTPFGMNSWGVAVWGALYKRELIEKIDWDFSNYTIAEDEFWTVQTKILSNKVAYVHEQLYCYRTDRLSSRSRAIKPMYFNGLDDESREISYISLGLEIFRKNTELFERHKVNLPEEPLLYGISVTKRLIKQCFNANKLDIKNSKLAKDIAEEFLGYIEHKKITVDKNEIFELELIKAGPRIFLNYSQTIEEDQKTIERLRHEVLLRDAELELLRKPSIKLASRKLAGAAKRRLRRGPVGKARRAISNRRTLSSVEMFDKRYSELRGIKKIRSSKKVRGRYIVTLTSYGDRISATTPRAIYSILSGKDLPDKIILWLAHGETVPESLKKLEQYGLEIRFTKDIKSYKKLIPALSEYPNDILITADDDVYYPHQWFAELKKVHKKHPDKIIANRADVITFYKNGKMKNYSNFGHGSADKKTHLFIPTGVGGILYPPGSLNKNVLNESEFMKLADSNDDIWFWAMAMLNKTEFTLTNSLYGNISHNPLMSIGHDSSEPTLWDTTNSQSGENRSTVALKNILEKWPEIRSRLENNN